jgi:hypothetical protein
MVEAAAGRASPRGNEAAYAEGSRCAICLPMPRAKVTTLQVRPPILQPTMPRSGVRRYGRRAIRPRLALGRAEWRRRIFLDVAGASHLFGGEETSSPISSAGSIVFGLPARLAMPTPQEQPGRWRAFIR